MPADSVRLRQTAALPAQAVAAARGSGACAAQAAERGNGARRCIACLRAAARVGYTLNGVDAAGATTPYVLRSATSTALVDASTAAAATTPVFAGLDVHLVLQVRRTALPWALRATQRRGTFLLAAGGGPPALPLVGPLDVAVRSTHELRRAGVELYI